MELVIGNKNYSSWSLRPWLLLTHFDIDFEETRIALRQPRSHEFLAERSPSSKVPVLIDSELIVWESLAICEYISETYLNNNGWPQHSSDKAVARAYASEIHAGFQALRSELPQNCRATRKVKLSEQAKHEINRVDGMWQDALNRHEGRFLFGDFSIADCMFAPVASRFTTYGIQVSDTSQAYIERVLTLPSMQRWLEAAIAEPEVIAAFEVGTDRD